MSHPRTHTGWIHVGVESGWGALQGTLPKIHGSYKFVQNPRLGLNSPFNSVYEGNAESLDLGLNKLNFSKMPPIWGRTHILSDVPWPGGSLSFL